MSRAQPIETLPNDGQVVEYKWYYNDDGMVVRHSFYGVSGPHGLYEATKMGPFTAEHPEPYAPNYWRPVL